MLIMPQEEVQEAAQKGGATSAGGFATMDPDKQVYLTFETQSHVL